MDKLSVLNGYILWVWLNNSQKLSLRFEMDTTIFSRSSMSYFLKKWFAKKTVFDDNYANWLLCKKKNVIINLWFYQMKRIDQGYKKNFCTGWQQSNFASTCIIALSLKFRSKCIITINFI